MQHSLFDLNRSWQRAAPAGLPTRKSRALWTLGNLLMLAGLYLLTYIGGIYSLAEYNRLAARGDSDIPAPVAVSLPEDSVPIFAAREPAAFTAPLLNEVGLAQSSVPNAAQDVHVAAVTRVVIPSIAVDSKVVEVGWQVAKQQGQQVAVWQVAEYAVGQHKGSANPGEKGNVVLAGHVGGYGKVFKDLYYVKPGDEIVLYSNGQQYLYLVQERLVLREEGVSNEQHAANARYIEPTDHEVVTMITCWPPKGADRFTERVVVRAVPYGTADSSAAQPKRQEGPSAWTLR